MTHLRLATRSIIATVSLAVLASPALGQLSVSGPGTYTQNFDSLANFGTAEWTDNTTLPGWFAAQTSGSVTVYTADDGNLSDGGLRSYGSTISVERALGSVNKGGQSTADMAYGVVFLNTGTAPLTIGVQYSGEWWRDGNNQSPEILEFTYKTSAFALAATNFDASSPTAAGFTRFPALDFNPSGGMRGAGGARDGNADAKLIMSDLTGVVLNPGEFASLRWFENIANGSDDGLALDNLSVTFTPVPEPGGVVGLTAAGVVLAGFARRHGARSGGQRLVRGVR